MPNKLLAMKKGVTIKDIAKKLHMSVSTVSKALNNNPSIGAFTKERVQLLAKEWNYIPNEAARHFKLNKTFTLGLIIPDLLDQFYVLAINGVEKVAGEEQYNVILSQSHEDPQQEEKIVDVMIRNRVDGLIVAITKHTKDMYSFQKLTDMGIPVVCMARTARGTSFNYVSSDNEEGAMKATEFLLKKGHQRVAYLMGPDSMQTSHTRLEGYRQALAKHKIPYDPALVKMVDLTAKSTANAMQRLMKMESPPTGIFAFKNYMALDAIDYLKNKYPEKLNEIDFVGFGNLPMLEYLDHKPIASIDENSYEMGIEATKLLFRIIRSADKESGEEAEHIKVPCKLVVRKPDH
jgi:LacI family transcriptional regulator